MRDVIKTPRLLLRPFAESDYPLLLKLSSDPDTVKYLNSWGRNGLTPEQDARRFLDYARNGWAKDPIRLREYCVTLRETGEAIGDASMEILEDQTAEIGWILLPDQRGIGYATEAGEAMMDLAFTAIHRQRAIAHCDTRNLASIQVMERLGMQHAFVEKEGRKPKYEGGPRGDEATWEIRRFDWAWRKYRKLTCNFQGFLPLPPLEDGAVRLTCQEEAPADPEKGWVPCLHFLIFAEGKPAGTIDLRLGTADSLFYSGHIGYGIGEDCRGKGYALRACRLLQPVLRLYGMNGAIITNDVNNIASRRVCEKLGCLFLCRARLPEDHDMRLREGMDEVNVFLLPAAD